MSSQSRNKINPLTVHSTFRDFNGQTVSPYGLQWHVDGNSHVSYAPVSEVRMQHLREIDWLSDKKAHLWIIDAHNKWCFAKDLPFRKVEDINNVSWRTLNSNTNPMHLQVEWKPLKHEPEQRNSISQIEGLLRLDRSSKGIAPPAEVWINGTFVAMLQPETLPVVLEAVANIPSRKMTYRKSRGILRIERRFVGRIVGQDIFEHLMDNLYAMEDPEAIDELTLIGTATLPDWIMGGELTSRLWIQELENGNILCLRPLYDDNTNTSDRKYELKRGKDDTRIATVREELERLRYLASLPSPFGDGEKIVRKVKSNWVSNTNHFMTHWYGLLRGSPNPSLLITKPN